jgi:pentatricopeptide repeat protein
VEGHINANNDHRVTEILGEMKASGIEPNVRTYTLILSVYGKQGKIDKMLSIFEKMKSSDIKPNHVSYSAIINAYVKAGELQEAVSWLDKMKADNIVPNMSPYSALIYGFANSKQYVMIERMVEQSKQNGLTMSKGLQKFVEKTLKEAGSSLESIVQGAQ